MFIRPKRLNSQNKNPSEHDALRVSSYFTYKSFLVFFVFMNLSAFVQQPFLQPADSAYIIKCYIVSFW